MENSLVILRMIKTQINRDKLLINKVSFGQDISLIA